MRGGGATNGKVEHNLYFSIHGDNCVLRLVPVWKTCVEEENRVHGDLYWIHVFLVFTSMSLSSKCEDTCTTTPLCQNIPKSLIRSPRQTPASTVRYILLFPPQSPTMATMNPNSRSQRAATPDTTVARRMAYFSAVLFVLGGLILISTSFAERNASHHTYREYKALNTTVLEDIWEQRRAFSGRHHVLALLLSP